MDGGYEEGDQRGGEGHSAQPRAVVCFCYDVDVEGGGIGGNSQGGHPDRREGKDCGLDIEGGEERPGVLGDEEDAAMLLQRGV